MWCNLPEDIIGIIIALLNFAGVAAVSAVCRPWRNAVKQLADDGHLALAARHLSWLTPSRHPETSTSALLKPIGRRTPLRNRRCCGAHHHWLVVVDSLGNLSLLLPFFREIPLPPSSNHPEEDTKLVHKVVLSSAPTEPGCMAAVIFNDTQLAVCCLGDTRWNSFESGFERERYYQDAVFYQGALVAVDTRQRVWSFRFEPGRVVRQMLPPTNPAMNLYNQFRNQRYVTYVCVVSEQLLMVVRSLRLFEGGLRTSDFWVLQLDSDAKCWDNVYSLGDHVMFLSRSMSVVVRSAEIDRMFLRDAIYFTGSGRPEDLGWFHMPYRLLWREQVWRGSNGLRGKVPVFFWVFDYDELMQEEEEAATLGDLSALRISEDEE